MVVDKEKIGIVYHQDYLIHTQSHHPERKERLEYITQRLNAEKVDDLVIKKDPQPALVEEIELVHEPYYIKSVEDACLQGKSFLDMDTYILPESYRVALLSTGGAITGLRSIMNNDFKKCFVFNRPPGHHAEKDKAMGFCIFNSVAVAAEIAKKEFNLKRIAILDWDVHHGNGTQHNFEKDSQVLFISLHQSPAYPGTGRVEETGFNEGEGLTVNIPLPGGCGDDEYNLAFDRIVSPVLNQFRPELIIVSAGQDAYRLDPLAGMELSHRGYYDMARNVAEVAARWSNGRVLLCLEGGYHFEGQAEAVLQVLNALGCWGLSGHETENRTDSSMKGEKRIEEVARVHSAFWKL